MNEKESIGKKKEYLNNYKNLYQKLKYLEEQLESLRDIAKSAKSQTLTGQPKGNKQTDISDYMVKLDLLEFKIKQQKDECLKNKLEVINSIADMTNGTESNLLYKRYIDFKSWEDISYEIGYAWSQTHRIHNNALKNFKISVLDIK